jgi:plastocyanin
MRKLLVLIGAVAAVAVPGAATAATVTVSITKNGYVPKAATIAVGDSVQFTNTDTVAHEVVFKKTGGVTCAPTPLALQPAQSGTCTFRNTGSYSYSDPNIKGNSFRGTVTVTGGPAPPADTITLAVKPLVVGYGGKVALSGVLSNQKVGENVDILAQACGQTAATKVTTVQTATGGTFVGVVTPRQNTVFTVKVKNTSSNAVSENVRPRLRLAKVASHRYSLRVFSAQSFAGKYATLQRYIGTRHRWVNVKRVLLRANRTGVAPTVISSVTFRSSIRARLKIRVVLPKLQVGTCYVAGRSNVILS